MGRPKKVVAVEAVAVEEVATVVEAPEIAVASACSNCDDSGRACSTCGAVPAV